MTTDSAADSAVRRGDVFWLELAEGRGSVPAVRHPHVVVQDDVFNASRIATVVVCATTTNPARVDEPGNVALDPGEGGLPKASVVIVSQISSVEKRTLGHPIGRISAARVDQIIAGLRFQQSYSRRS